MVLVAVVLEVIITLVISRILSRTLLRGCPPPLPRTPSYRRPQVGKILIRSVRRPLCPGKAVSVAAPAGLFVWLILICVEDVSLLDQVKVS